MRTMTQLAGCLVAAAWIVGGSADVRAAGRVLHGNCQVRIGGHKIDCSLVLKCGANDRADEIIRQDGRWLCCDTRVGDGIVPVRGTPPPPAPELPAAMQSCFDLVRDDGFPLSPLDGTAVPIGSRPGALQ